MEEQKKENGYYVGLPQKLPNFYRPSTFIKKKEDVPKKVEDVVLPQNGEWYTPKELMEIEKAGRNLRTFMEEVYYPETGGVFTKVKGYKYSIRGVPMENTVRILALIKAVIPALAEFVFEIAKNPFALMFRFKRASMNSLFTLLHSIHRAMDLGSHEKLFPDSYKLYCQVAQEVHRTLSKVFNCPESITELEVLEILKGEKRRIAFMTMVRDILDFILEFDNAYRYRLQDLAGELNKEAFLKNPGKEIERVMFVVMEREHSPWLSGKWKKILKAVKIYLKVDFRLKQYLKELVSEVDLEKLKLQEDDKYFCDARTDYDFEGKKR